MARKRINKEFATILLAVLGGSGVIGAAGWYFLRAPESATKYEQLSNAAIESRDWINAYTYYAKVVKLSPGSAEKWTKLGELARYAGTTKRELAGQDRIAWERALEIDTKYAPALKALLNYEWEVAKLAPSPAEFARVRQLAERSVAADPNNKEAAALIPTSTVQGWLADIETDPARLDADLKELQKLVHENPANVETLSVLFQAFMKKAELARQSQRPKEAAAAVDSAVAAVDDALKQQDQNLVLHLRAFSMYAQLRDDRNLRADVDVYTRKYRAALERARALAEPGKPLYLDVNLEAANDAARQGDINGADQIYTRLLEQQPGNQVIRLSYASFLQTRNETRGKAIALLEKEIDRAASADPTSVVGADRIRNLEMATRVNLATYRLDAAAARDLDPKARDEILDKAGAEIAKLEMDLPEVPQPMILRGRLELIRNKNVEAVQTLGRAKALMDRNPQSQKTRQYFELLLRMADAYAASQQTGPAKDTLRLIIDRLPTLMEPRRKLIELMIRERASARDIKRELEDAEAHLGKEDTSGREMLNTVRIALSQGEDPKSAGNLVDKMPETTRAERLNKAELLSNSGQFDRAADLFGLAFAEDSKDARVAIKWVQTLAKAGKSDAAKAAAHQAADLNPDNLQLKLLVVSIEGGTKQDLEKVIRDETDKIPDEFERERRRYEIAVSSDNRTEALEHLKKATALQPKNKWVLDQTFQNYLIDRKFDEAQAMLTMLSDGNFDEARGNLYRVKLLIAKGQPQEAVRIARQLTSDLPQFSQSWLALGQAYGLTGDMEQSLLAFQQALERQPNNIDALRGTIDANYRLGRPQEARRYLKDALNRFPNDPGFRETMLNDIAMYGDAAVAVRIREQQAQEREQALSAHPDDPAYKPSMAGVLGDLGMVYEQVVQSSQTRGDTAAARAMATKAANAYTRALEFQPTNIEILKGLARVARQAEDPLDVEKKLIKAVDSPQLVSDWQPMVIMGDHYAATGRGAEAEKAVREAVRRGGSEATPRKSAANILTLIGKADDAIAMLDGITNAAADRGIQRQRAEIYIRAARFDQAEKVIRSLLINNTEDNDLQTLLMIVFVNSQRFDEANRIIASSLARDPKNLTAVYYRALIQLQSPGGDVNAALRDLQFVRDNGVLSPEMQMVLVEAYRRTGDQDNMVKTLVKVVRDNPTNKPIRLQLTDLYLRQTPAKSKEALDLLDEGLKLPALAGDADLLLSKARILMVAGDAAQAISISQNVAAKTSAAPAVRAYLEILVAAKENKKVLDETDALVNNATVTKPYWVYVSRAIAQWQLGNRDASTTEFALAMQAAVDAKDDEQASQVAGLMSQTLGPKVASEALTKRLEEGPRWRLMASLLYRSQNEFKEALNVLEPAMAALDKLPVADRNRVLHDVGLLLVSEGPQQNYERAVDVYRKILATNPDQVETLNNIAFILSEKLAKPNPAAALEYSQHAFELISRTGTVEPLIYDTHGWILVLNNRVAEGINILNQASGKANFVELHYHLGAAYIKAGFAKEAIPVLARAAKLAEQKGADTTYKLKIEAAQKEADTLIKQQANTK